MIEPMNAPDEEVADLFARFLDRRLDESGRARLEQRMRDEPAVLEYCARVLRFDADLQESLNPQRLEVLETRRMIISQDGPKPDWEVQHTQTVRYGHPATPHTPIEPVVRRKRRRLLWLLLIPAFCFAAWLIFPSPKPVPSVLAIPVPSPLILRNASFEAPELSLSPDGISNALMEWQDYFSTDRTQAWEINRVSGGRIFAKSGRNVARLAKGGWISQQLRLQNGSPLTAKPRQRVVVSGWAFAQGRPPYSLRVSLRFIANSMPKQIQYEAAMAAETLQPGDWHPFRIELLLPNDLNSAVYYSNVSPLPAKLDLQGRELTLTITNLSAGDLLMDSLEAEELEVGLVGGKMAW